MSRAKRSRRRKGEGSIFQRGDGMWIAKVMREDGTYYQRGRARHDDAMVELRKMLEEVRDGIDPAAGTATIDEWMDYWLDAIAATRVRPGTLDTYRSAVKQHIRPNLGTKQLSRLRPADIRLMVKTITDRRSTRTAQAAFNILSKALDDAVNEGTVRENPCHKMDRPEALSEERAPLTVDQARSVLLHVAGTENPLLASRWTLSLLSGVRQGEALGLEWGRVDFDQNVLDVSKQLRRVRLKPGTTLPDGDLYPKDVFAAPKTYDLEPLWKGMCLVDTKTKGSQRIIPMLPPLKIALQALRDQTPADQRLVFTRPGGMPVKAMDDTAAWRQVCVEAGVVPSVAKAPDQHASRNTVATLLLEAGVEESVRMQILGHTTVTAHRGYVSTSTDVTRDALGKMVKLLKLDEPADQPPAET
ncbi:tyrosine-type recombinase/integrase [Gordonia sp. (in: high G+C Gram-positive bacteria)]|uniref:tyrosine-type recombinase/integrase n=1 Tax=Gordonia sp. (in: high G+C Gram-positive bacteria) TaxID=84139 RepID=UPI0039E41006